MPGHSRPSSMVVLKLSEIARQLERPFTLHQLAAVGHLGVHVYVCMGMVDWHRHPDEDELFLVHEGSINLDTEAGNLTLEAEELVVVPKGVAHRSGSRLRSIVLLVRPGVLTHRINGRRRVAILPEEIKLEKQRLAQHRRELNAPYQTVLVAGIEEFRLELGLALGTGPDDQAPRGGRFLLGLRGGLSVAASEEQTTLAEGDALLLPAGVRYQLEAREEATYLTLALRSAG